MIQRSLFLLVACVCLVQCCFSEERKPNIVLIVADDLGYNDTGFMGSKEMLTPNLDKLAHSGVILRSHYVQPVCSPTRSALMTGRNPGRTGVYTVVRPNAPWGLPLDERTLANALRDVGYETAISGKWHLGEYQPEYRPTKRGFDHQYGLWFGMIDNFTHKRDGTLDWHRNDQPCEDGGYSTHLIAKEACRIVKEKQEGKPLFLYLPFNAVHTPLQAPDNYRKAFPKLTGQRQAYAAMLAAMDEAVGQVVAALEEKKQLDNTLFIFTSDNGGPSPGPLTDNTPLRAGKGTIYEGGIRACAFACWPGKIPAGKVSDEPVHAVDWFPTLAKLTGATADSKKPLDGKDIWPVLAEGAKSPHESLVLWGTVPSRVALRAGDWKLLVNPSAKDAEDEDAEDSTSDKIELYNLAEDIGEKKNRAKDLPEKVIELRALLKERIKDAVPTLSNQTKKKKGARK